MMGVPQNILGILGIQEHIVQGDVVSRILRVLQHDGTFPDILRDTINIYVGYPKDS